MKNRTSLGWALILAGAWVAGCSSAASPGDGDVDGAVATEDAADAALDAAAEADATVDAADAADATDADARDAAVEADAPFEGGLCASPMDLDSDGDHIPDSVEGRGKTPPTDTDHDGTPDYLDLDSDGDTIPDEIEGDTIDVGCYTPVDSDGDGTPDFQQTDSDSNGLPDRDEVYPDGKPYDPNHAKPNPAVTAVGSMRPDYSSLDNDNDTILDVLEVAPSTPVASCAPKMPPDTDCDGLPDLDDLDADDDTIADEFEGSGDFDHDGVPNFRDTDSDSDGLSDLCEAGPNLPISRPPPDTDNDGFYDEVDLDADGDGLSDTNEDANHDCVLDPMETSPTKADTDGDGISDLIETALVPAPADCAITPGCKPCARDPFCTPDAKGKFYFVLPYQQVAQPRSRLVPVSTALQRADVAFMVQTTGSVGPSIQALKSSITSFIGQLGAVIPDLTTTVAAFDDYPVSPYGATNNLPFYLAAPGAYLTSDVASVASSITNLYTHTGVGLAKGDVLGFWHAITNQPLYWPGGSIDADLNVPSGRYGALGFRPDALAVLVGVGDAPFHNGRRATAPGQGGALHDVYSFAGSTLPASPPTIDDVVGAMNAKGARFVGLALDNGSRGNTGPYPDMAYLADATASTVPPSAFGGQQCLTGLSGNPIALPDGPNGSCRLVFDLNTGSPDINGGVISGITALAQSLTFTVRVVAVPDASPPAAVDAVDTFVRALQVEPFPGSFKDPTDPTVPCVTISLASSDPTHAEDDWTGPKGLVQSPDNLLDTVTSVQPPTKICFRLDAQDNYVVPSTQNVQVFHAILQVKAKNGQDPVELDFGPPRDVLFVIPPTPQ